MARKRTRTWPPWNGVIFLLLLSDVLVLTGFGLVDPVIAVFINDKIIGGSVFTIGVASAIFLITKSVVQLPFARHVDTHDDRDDAMWLIIGTSLVACTPLIYLFATHIWMIFLAQFIYGLGSGFAYPTWLGLWSTHLDKGHESFEWTFYSTSVSIGTAIAAAVGAGVAQLFGFRVTFIMVFVLMLIGVAILFGLFRQKLNGVKDGKATHYHTRRRATRRT